MDRLLAAIDRRIHGLLATRGVLDDLGEGTGSDSWRDEALASGRGHCHARGNGFDLINSDSGTMKTIAGNGLPLRPTTFK